MKFVDIFVDALPNVLFAVEYEDKAENEYDRLMNLWTDMSYLFEYAKKNNTADINKFREDISQNIEDFEDVFNNIKCKKVNIDKFFQPLTNTTTKESYLSFQKAKQPKNSLRFYALKIDDNMFLITGGAIKMSQVMKDHPDTLLELEKLKRVQTFLKNNGVFDEDSFFELLIEQS